MKISAICLCAMVMQLLYAQTIAQPVKVRKPVIVSPKEGDKIGRLTWKLTSAETGGSIAVAELYNNDSAGIWQGGHVHTREDELWYVMEGELEFGIAGDTVLVKAGSWVFGPRSLPHSYRVSKIPARYLIVFTPGGIEDLFTEADSLRRKFTRFTEYREKIEEVRAKYGGYDAKKWQGITNAEDPSNGTWELDTKASVFQDGPSWKQQVHIYKSDGKNSSIIITGVDSKGKTTRYEYIGAYDEKDYPINKSSTTGTVTQVRTDYYTVKASTKRNGIVTATSTRVVSKDEQLMTITSTGTNAKGVAFTNTLVLRKR